MRVARASWIGLAFATALGGLIWLNDAVTPLVGLVLARFITIVVGTVAALLVGSALLRREERQQRRESAEALRRVDTERLDDALRTDAILRTAVDGFVVIDERGIIQSVNGAIEKTFGYSSDELVGRNVKILMPAPYREEHDSYLANYLGTGERKIIGIGREVVGRRKDGSTFPMDLAVSEVELERGRYFVGTIREITDRKRMQEELERQRDFAEGIVQTAPAIVLVLDCDGRIVQYNHYLERLTKFPLDEARGKDWFDHFIPEADRPTLRDLFRRCLAEPSAHGNVNPILTRDGEQRFVAWYDKPLTDGNGETTGVLAIGLDVTERRALEEQLRHAQKMEAIGRLAGGVAHDFNTLLGSILGYSEMILDRPGLGSAAAQQAEQIRRSAERGSALTRQLLAFSRRQVLEPTIVDLNRVVRGMADMLRRLVSENTELAYDLAAGLGSVRIDANQIEQVILNLVVNSADAIGSNGGRILIETRNLSAEPEAGERVVLAVTDDGCGMDDDTQSQAFEPFFTTKERGKGTGLGLATVYGIVTQSDGDVRLESRPGAGARFEIRLPRDEATPVEEIVESSGPDRPTAGTEQILVVEDDPMFLEMLAELLRHHGYRVLAIGDPLEAIERVAELDRPVDLTVSDMVMPGISGEELGRRLVERNPQMKIILMSGYTDDELGEARTDDADRSLFLHKPFPTKALLAAVRELLDPPASGAPPEDPAAGGG